MVYGTYRVACLALRERHPICHLGGECVHADDAFEPSRIGVEQMRQGLKDSALSGAHQRTVRLLGAFAPGSRTRLQQPKKLGRTSDFKGQVVGQSPVLHRETADGESAMVGGDKCTKRVGG